MTSGIDQGKLIHMLGEVTSMLIMPRHMMSNVPTLVRGSTGVATEEPDVLLRHPRTLHNTLIALEQQYAPTACARCFCRMKKICKYGNSSIRASLNQGKSVMFTTCSSDCL